MVSSSDLAESLPDARRWCIAYSGGLDSTVLLHLAVACRSTQSITVTALHVDHGLHPQAADWSEHCRQQCRRLDIPLEVIQVEARAGKGESPEAAARSARYEAFAGRVGEGDCLLTAHHRDDQAETVLLQLLRGAGPHGLAAMPALERFAGGWHARPLLQYDRDDLLQHAEAHGLEWIDDPSNADTGLRRNFLRHEILPRLKEVWPAAARTLSRSATHNAAAARLLDELARDDLATLADHDTDTLSIAGLKRLGADRQANALRAWLHDRGLPLPSTAHLDRLRSDVLDASPDSNPLLTWPGAEVRRYRDRLYAMPPLPAHDSSMVLTWDMATSLVLPAGGRLAAARCISGDEDTGPCLRLPTDDDGPVTVRFRQGGERCRPAGRDGSHSLKQLLQETGVPPWQRERLPLIHYGEALVAVAGVCVCEGWQASPGIDGIRVQYLS